MKFLFWSSLFLALYAYAGYVAFLSILNIFKKAAKKGSEYYPFISLIIAAYNEERSIEEKLNNLRLQDYPADKLEVIVVSDASTDKTEEIVRRFSATGIKLMRQEPRAGKTAAQNLAVNSAKGEILVFSDATTIYENDALKKIIRNFRDPRVGCAGGQEKFLNPRGGKITEEVSLLWRYEKFLRRMESKFNTCIGVSGCIFAIRRNLYERLDENLIEDFTLPLRLGGLGYRVVYEEEAIAYEEAAVDSKQEFSRKARIVCGGINVVWKMRHLLNPLRYPLLSFQIISHKIMRWLTPLFLLLLLVSNLFILGDALAYAAFGSLQASAYLLAFAGYWYRNKPAAPKIFKSFYHLLMVNLADITGILRFLKGERKVIWEPLRLERTK